MCRGFLSHLLAGLVLLLLVMLAGVAEAVPTANEEDSIQVVITAARVPQPIDEAAATVSVVTAEEIASMQARNVAEALRLLPGVIASSYGSLGSVTSISVRGSSANQVMVMLDGRLLNSAQSGAFDLGLIPVDNIERIELLRGPASSLYGAYALGGVINIITRSGRGPAATDLNLSVGGLATARYGFSHGGESGKAAYFISVGQATSEGFRDNSSYKSADYSARVDFDDFAAGALNISLQGHGSRKGAPGSESWTTPMALQRDYYSKAALDFSRKDSGGESSLTLYHHNHQLNYDDEDPFWPQSSSHASQALGLNWQRVSRAGDAGLTYGLEARRDDADSSDSGLRQADTLSFFVHGELPAGEDVVLHVGGRHDDNSIYGSSFSPRIAANYQAGDSLIRASYGQGFRPPVFQDLYWPYSFWAWDDWVDPDVGHESITSGNPDLNPEYSTSWELGLERMFGATTLRANLFDQLVRDLMRWQSTNSTRVEGGKTIHTEEWMPVNIAKAAITGLELELARPLLPGLQGHLSYSWLDARDADSGQSLTYSPQNRAVAGLHFNSGGGLFARLDATYTGGQRTGEWTPDLPDWVRVDLRLSRKMAGGQGSLTLGVENLFDSQYYERAGYPVPGRLFNFGMRWVF